MIRNNGIARILSKNFSQIRNAKSKPLSVPALETPSVPKDCSIRETIAHVLSNYNEKSSFYLVHLQKVVSQFERWNLNLPTILPHYAVKSNPDRRIIQTLSSLGANFDCASMKEIQDVLSITKDPKRIVFAHPFKIPHHLEYAATVGVNRMTADNVSELEKIRFFHKNAKIQIRMKPDDSNSLCKFSAKFGATIEEAFEMLDYAKRNNMEVVGTSFHVGSGCQSSSAFSIVLEDCAAVFTRGIEMGFPMTVLNIGGGFPGLGGSSGDSFEQMAEVISESLKTKFGHFKDLELMAEPGRFFSSGASTLVTNVFGKKEYVENNIRGFKYYMDEGVYGAFNCTIFDHAKFNLEVLKPRIENKTFNSVFWGPTCDSMDKIGEFDMPELFVGDTLFVQNFGSYTSASSSEFNGFKNTSRYYVASD